MRWNFPVQLWFVKPLSHSLLCLPNEIFHSMWMYTRGTHSLVPCAHCVLFTSTDESDQSQQSPQGCVSKGYMWNCKVRSIACAASRGYVYDVKSYGKSYGSVKYDAIDRVERLTWWNKLNLVNTNFLLNQHSTKFHFFSKTSICSRHIFEVGCMVENFHHVRNLADAI